MSELRPLPEWAKGPAHCLACGKLSYRPAGMDAAGELVCPECDSIDVYVLDVPEGLFVIQIDGADTENDETVTSELWYALTEGTLDRGSVASRAIQHAEKLQHALSHKRAVFNHAVANLERARRQRDTARAERDQLRDIAEEMQSTMVSNLEAERTLAEHSEETLQRLKQERAEDELRKARRDGAETMRNAILWFHDGTEHFGDEFACPGHPPDETCKPCELKDAIETLNATDVLEEEAEA